MSGRRYQQSRQKDNEKNRGPRGPRKLSSVIADVMVRRGYARSMTASAYVEAWQAATDDVLSKASRPGNLRRGVLEVTVRNSAVLQELTFQKKKILKVLNKQISDQSIVDLRFRVGNID